MSGYDYLIWGGAIALVVGFFVWEWRCRARADANFRALAQKYQMQISTSRPNQGPYAEGRLDSRIFRFSKLREPRAGQGIDLLWFELEVAESRGFTFHLQEKNVGLDLVRELGEAGVTIGDPEFDLRWHADTNEPEKFRRTFSPPLRELVDIATAASRWGEIRLLDGWLSYREQDDLDGPAIEARFDGLRKMLADLADAVESTDEKKASP